MSPAPAIVARCPWAAGDPLLLRYHDDEWGVPAYDDHALFEMLVLEGAQAGLSWLTVLRRRARYQTAFHHFDWAAVASLEIDQLMEPDLGVIRNRAKLGAAIRLAQVIGDIRQEYPSFSEYIWGFVGGHPTQNQWRSAEQIPQQTSASRALSADLTSRGCHFVGPTICYAFMQACGLVNDHLIRCFRYRELAEPRLR